MSRVKIKNSGDSIFDNVILHNDDYLRDIFATAALQALITKAPFHVTGTGDETLGWREMLKFQSDIAHSAYLYADAMMIARGNK